MLYIRLIFDATADSIDRKVTKHYKTKIKPFSDENEVSDKYLEVASMFRYLKSKLKMKFYNNDLF